MCRRNRTVVRPNLISPPAKYRPHRFNTLRLTVYHDNPSPPSLDAMPFRTAGAQLGCFGDHLISYQIIRCVSDPRLGPRPLATIQTSDEISNDSRFNAGQLGHSRAVRTNTLISRRKTMFLLREIPTGLRSAMKLYGNDLVPPLPRRMRRELGWRP